MKYLAKEGDFAVIGVYEGYRIFLIHEGRDAEWLTSFNNQQENELRAWIEEHGLVRLKRQWKKSTLAGWYRKRPGE